MIPLKIQLKNFLSYGPQLQTIDFTDHHLICLSGKNGHGKSALLDAITWALWGQARKIAGAVRADASLLRLGQVQVLVIFDFESNGNKYRIKREFFKQHGTRTLLEFGLIKSDNDELIPLTDKTIKATQDIIEKTVGISFETFINSAFLRQGNSNEFSKKSPQERKQILANILSLGTYDVIKKQASEKIKVAQTKKEVLKQLQEQRLLQQEKKTDIDAQYKNIEQGLQKITTQEQAIAAQELDFLQKFQICKEKKHSYDLLISEEKKILEEKEQLETAIRLELKLWRDTNKKLRHIKNKELLEKQKTDILKTISNQQIAFQKQLEIKQKLFELQSVLQNKITTSQQEAQAIEKTYSKGIDQIKAEQIITIQQIEYVTQRYTAYENEITQYIKEKDEIHNIILQGNVQQKIFSSTKIQFEKRKAAYQQYVAKGNFLRQNLKELHQKETLQADENNPTCPLCEQNLSASRRKFLKHKFTTEQITLTHRLERLQRIIPKLKALLVTQHEELQKFTKIDESAKIAVAQEQKLIEKIDTLQKGIEQEKKSLETVKKKELDLQLNITKKEVELQKELEQNKEKVEKIVADTKKDISTVQNELKSFNFNEEQLKKDQLILQKIELDLESCSQQNKYLNEQQERKLFIASNCKTLKRIKISLQKLQSMLKQYVSIDQDTKKIEQEIQLLHENKKKLAEDKDSLLQQKGRVESLQAQLETIAMQYKQEEKNIALLEQEIEDFNIIATATGKDGIQALLIEHAIPEIEQETNNLLSKLTTNNTQIFIDSLKDLKKGGTKETLDIKISDPMGIRPYELFSGGEAFRIDLALRIAISKLLARRAGTALQTLIIDEGFGSQDEQGLHDIMESLHAIQDDFSKIIVVSHLSEMKDQFPVHFFVQKGIEGSKVQIIEQG